jgi:hypothetical protein
MYTIFSYLNLLYQLDLLPDLVVEGLKIVRVLPPMSAICHAQAQT